MRKMDVYGGNEYDGMDSRREEKMCPEHTHTRFLLLFLIFEAQI